MIASIAAMKPPSSSWSHSSRTSTSRPFSRSLKPSVEAMCSRSRPGVAIMRSIVPPYWHALRCEPVKLRSSRSRCGWMLAPPMIVSMVNSGRFAASFSACTTIWVPSSRALLSTSARTGSTPPSSAGRSVPALRSSRSTVGTRKPKVLPVPVFAFARMSHPARQCGMHSRCTCVRAFTPASASALVSRALTSLSTASFFRPSSSLAADSGSRSSASWQRQSSF
mmetsp:Transcript_63398/g.166060  ORF Transcript_63398/g.166060 Transcript_63398/m.166060 type:complete len:223 (+) Transcript_63398:387-1055(+)